jgi:LDH2 family malate/lactate/ureidoglycolate dehydrogenase
MEVSIDDARSLAESAMRSAGYDDDEAAVIADHLVDCELRGVTFGGLARALSVIERLEAAGGRGRPITVVRDSPAAATIDGGDQVGYLVGRRATDLAIAKAATAGLAVVGAHETWYTGMFSYYLELITAAGCVGMIAGSGGHIVAPAGGTQGRFGTNPIAFGFPSAGDPVIWDIGTSSIMLGEVLLAHRQGAQLPEGAAYDRHGLPAVEPMEALGGAFTVWGGHKGSGLALVVQLLGMLCGAAAAPDGLSDCGFFVLVIDPGLLTSPDDYRSRVSAYAKSIRATRPVEGGAPVRVPFDRSAAQRRATLEAGMVAVPDEVWTALSARADGPGAAGGAGR